MFIVVGWGSGDGGDGGAGTKCAATATEAALIAAFRERINITNKLRATK